MSVTYHIKIKKDYAAAVIADLEKMKAVELTMEENSDVPDWQKKEVLKRAKESKKNPSILVEEAIVFNILKNK